MWLAGAVGITVALGYYLIALAVAVFAVLVLAALRAFSHRVVGDAGQKQDNPDAKGTQGSDTR